MALFWRSKRLLIKPETVYNTDPAPTGAANAILAVDVKVMPMEGKDVSRELDLPFFGAQPTLPADLHAKISFKVELAPSGLAGTAPAWGPLLRGCGCAQTIVAATSVTYNPITTGIESVTIYLYIENTLYKISGARGTVKFALDASGIPYMEYEFTGLFTLPVEGVKPTVDLTAFAKPRLASSANTPTFNINGVTMPMRSYSLDMGNAVETRFLIGSESVLITDHAEQMEIKVEAVPLTILNPYQLAANQTDVAVNLIHGIGAGARATIAIPKMQMQRPAGLDNQQNIVEWTLRGVPQPNLGNDQWTLALT